MVKYRNIYVMLSFSRGKLTRIVNLVIFVMPDLFRLVITKLVSNKLCSSCASRQIWANFSFQPPLLKIACSAHLFRTPSASDVLNSSN